MGPYRVRRVLATGTLGPVLLVDVDGGGTPLVIKLIQTEATGDAEALASELASLIDARIEHPGLVSVTAVGADHLGAYLVMPHVEAPTLASGLQHGRQPLTHVLEWLGPVAAGLHHAHVQGVHHGAVHPRDVLLARPHGVLTGVGVSSALEALGLQAPVRVPFTAPERASGRPWDARADQYSLAMLALDGLSGRRLIAGTIPAFDRWTLADTPAEDARLHEVFARALDPDPAARFASVADWLEALAAAVGASSDLSRFTRDGVIPADVRRDIQVESLDERDGLALSLFAPESADVGAPGDALTGGLTGGLPGGLPVPAAVDDGDQDTSPDQEWLVAAVPDTPDADDSPWTTDDDIEQQALEEETVEPVTPIETDAAADPAVPDEDDTLYAPVVQRRAPVVLWDQPVEPVDEDDLSLSGAPIATGREADADLGDADAFSSRADTDEDRNLWERDVDDGEDSGRRSLLVLIAVLLVVAALGYGTWRSLQAPPDAASSVARVPAAGVGAPETGDEPRDAQPPADVREEPLVLAPDALAPGTDIDLPDAAPKAQAGVPAAPASARTPAQRVEPAPAPPPTPSAPPARSAAPAAPPIAAPAAGGRVLIRASPAGEVRVNGQDRGTTPVVLRDLPFGVYSITISRPGFVTATREVNLVPSQPVASLAIDLERGEPRAAPAPPTRPAETGAPAGVPPASTPGGAQRPTGASGSLFVVSSPSGARLLIDGQPYGTTPAAIPNLAEGTHRIRLALPGHQPWEGTAHVRANQRVRVEATLVQGSR